MMTDGHRIIIMSMNNTLNELELGMAKTTTTTSMTETTPLLSSSSLGSGQVTTRREKLFQFLEAQTTAGRYYERFIIVLIATNVVAFIFASLFVETYNPVPWASRQEGICGNVCDALWFGNYADNGLQHLHLGATSILEIGTVLVFTIEYLLRLYTADLESPKYEGFWGRIRFIPTFFSMVDLASTVPFYVDAFLVNTDLASSSFLRMFRLLRMMRVEGRYNTALTMVDDVYQAQKAILGTALFIGFTTWMTVSSLYYLVERRNHDMIYCGAATHCSDEVDTSLCTIDDWGLTDCSDAGCPPTDENPEPCYNLFNSIPMSSYYSLLNLFGEFPLVTDHSSAGQVVGTLVAVVAVAVFALPAGIIGNGFEDVIEKQREQEYAAASEMPIIEQGGMTRGFAGSETTRRGWWYNLLHAQTVPGAIALDHFINILVVSTAVTFMLDTLGDLSPSVHVIMDSFELVSVTIFTMEYCMRVYAAKEDPKYNRGGRWAYMTTFLAVVDVLSFAPFWLEVFITGRIITPTSDSGSTWSNVVKSLRLLRILRFEKYTHAFTSFDDVFSRNKDVLAVTAFTALLFWVFFGAFLYLTERDNPDQEMASNYNTVPNAMWITLLNLAGECPLSQYSGAGKVATGVLGLFATGVFGIPIGVLGAGFEEVVERENPDDVEELIEQEERNLEENLGTSLERKAFNFVNGIGSKAAKSFEMLIYGLIFIAVSVGVWQTVDGHENDFHEVEWITVIIFTIEYLIRLVGAGADPQFAKGRSALGCRLRFLVSFYSIIDLLAIVPFYIAFALPNSIVDEYDEYLRMFRILRLVKLDKYIPSITLIDDVIRLKFNSLRVACYAAMTLWILFAALLFLTEHKDLRNGIDPVPEYGCDDSCTMIERFHNYFDSMVYTGVHLTGDYPIITYSWPARFANLLMVIAAVGVVSIPSGLIASGFVEIVQSKNKRRKESQPQESQYQESQHECSQAGDDWYEFRYRELEGVEPPRSRFGPKVDRWQYAVNEFLNGKEGEHGHAKWTRASFAGRVFIFTVIIANVVAVVVESMPKYDKWVGNQPGNFFDSFEAFSVMVFAAEYILRLFCARKNREALYSPYIYATTFFGIVDFMSTAPWFIQQLLIISGNMDAAGDNAKIFRIFRVFRILQLEDFFTAFSKLDNVFRASKDVLKATGLMALIIWVGCGALFHIFEGNNPNWRVCDESIPLRTANHTGCYDFSSTAECNKFYPGLCSQTAFMHMPNALYLTAVFLGGEWGLIDFTWPGRVVCLFLCVVGIALYAIPIGTLFDSFGAVLMEICEAEDGEDGEEEEEEQDETKNGDKQ